MFLNRNNVRHILTEFGSESLTLALEWDDTCTVWRGRRGEDKLSVFGLYVKRSRVDFYGILFFAVYYMLKRHCTLQHCSLTRTRTQPNTALSHPIIIN